MNVPARDSPVRALAQQLAELPDDVRRETLAKLSPFELAALRYCWPLVAREEQLAPPGDWGVWLILAGRGAGKTRSGAEWIREGVEAGQCRRVALVGATAADARNVMVEGESGILNTADPNFRPHFNPSLRRVTWPNGAEAYTYSAEEADRLRGPQHDRAWADEVAAWRHPGVWDMLMFGLRLGANPQVLATTTPKPTKLIRRLIAQRDVHVTRGSTYDNEANLAPKFLDAIRRRYEGTRLGMQEIYAQVLEDVEGALWTTEMIDRDRLDPTALDFKLPDMQRIVIGVDPAVSAVKGRSDETGIVVVGLGKNRHLYVLDDVSGILAPSVWARRVVDVYTKRKADRVVAEVNNGGDLVEANLRAVGGGAAPRLGGGKTVAYKAVHATRGKILRAEPVSGLYEQRLVHHVGCFAELEQQMTEWQPIDQRDASSADGLEEPERSWKSPDRLDALVWAIHELVLIEQEPESTASKWARAGK